MAKRTQGYFCPYCGNWNSITSRRCEACGEEMPNAPLDNPGGGTTGSRGPDSEPTIIESILGLFTGGNRFRALAVLTVCCVAALAAVVGVYISSSRKTEPIVPEPVNESSASSEPAAEPAASQISNNTEGDEHEYTAPALRLTSFGGETTGNQLIVHNHVHDNYYNEYEAGLGGVTTNVENVTEYLIGDQYRYLSFRVVLNYDKRTDYHPDTNVRVYADGAQIYESEDVHSGFKPTDVTLDIRGVERLAVGICGYGDIRVVDAVLHNDEGYEQYSTMVPYTNKQDFDQVPLSYLKFWNGSSAELGLEYIPGTIQDRYGHIYDGAFAGTHEDQDNWVEYDITDCGFTKLTGTIIMNTEPGGTDEVTPIVAIYNGPWLEQLYRSDPVTNETGTQRFEVSLKNSKQFRVQISGRHNVRLVDCYLSK